MRFKKGFFTAMLGIALTIAGCSGATTQSGGLTPDNLANTKWDDVLAQAKDKSVNMYMWGGSDTINRYMDEWVAPRLKQETGVTLHRVPVNDIKDIMNKLLTEKQAGKKDGSVDIIWINGENFKFAKENQLLWGSFAGSLPNFTKYVNQDAPDVKYDFGQDTQGLEAPWGKAQFVFAYDSAKIANPPKSIQALKEWVKQNPGKFTYPAPPDFTGSAFIRNALYETTGGYEQYMKSLDDKATEPKLAPLWSALNELEPFLWRQGKTYPESLAKLDQLYSNGEVWMTMGYDPARATNMIQNGKFPASTRTFVLDQGTLSNTHYLSIPYNSSNPSAALIAINFLLSPAAQIAKYDPAHWGEDMSLEPSKLSGEEQKRIESTDRGVATLSADELKKHRVPEIPSEYVDFLEKGWMENVVKK